LGLPATDYHHDIKHQDTIIKISPERVEIDGKVFQTENTGKAMLTEIYKSQVGVYPKFYKMDSLARLAFVASELLIKTVKDIDAEHTSLVLFNRTSSIVSDRQHHSEMMNLPSPSVFVYTLPNIMTGEIAIRNGLKGETSLYIIDRKDWSLMESIAVTCFCEQDIHHIIYGWVDYKDDMNFEAEIKYI
jgi:3-oxoacyl-[acyl-carrier-protein] synthase-1